MEFLPSQLEDRLALLQIILPKSVSLGAWTVPHVTDSLVTLLAQTLTPATHVYADEPSYLMELLDPRLVGASLLENQH